MDLLASDSDLCHEIGARAAETMRSSFSEEAVAKIAVHRLGTLYRELGIGRPTEMAGARRAQNR